MQLYSDVTAVMHEMQAVDLGTYKKGPNTEPYPVSCHMMTRAIADILPQLRVVDGYFMRNNEHSWLATEDPNFIIDVYPVCTIGGPLLVFIGGISPMRELYRPATLHTVQTMQFQKHCEMVTGAMRAGFHRLLAERKALGLSA
jgi:hypothetical protein